MIKDVWDSFKDNIKDRVTNPFLGTFLLVWVVKNWKVVYGFFFFDNSYKLQSKFDFFSEYWKNKNFISDLFFNAVLTIGILIVVYIFLALSRFLSNYFENVILPFIYKISRGKYVTIDVHQGALEKIRQLENRVDEERKTRNEIMRELEEKEKRANGLTVPESDAPQNDYKQLILALSESEREEMNSILLGISKRSPFSNDNDIINFLIKYGFIEVDRKPSHSASTFKFTEIGMIFRKQFFEMELSK